MWSAIRSVMIALVLVAALGSVAAWGQVLRVGQAAPELAGQRWINSAPLTMQGLRGRVVAVEFWTYG